MLQSVFINKKKVPVPVPIAGLRDAVSWTEEFLIKPGYSLTRIELDGDLIDFDDPQTIENITLNSHSKLFLQLDSAADMCVQILDTLKHLTSLHKHSLQKIAVRCWTWRDKDIPTGVIAVSQDMQMILDLIFSFVDLAPQKLFLDYLKEQATVLRNLSNLIEVAMNDRNWKACAKILLNKFEPLAEELADEYSRLSSPVFEWQIEFKKRA